jgi:Reverse transcriptase (RNA-dependent DNA polymerase)
MAYRGIWRGICQDNLHREAIANMLSFSQLRLMGHSITYNEGSNPEDDSFTIAHGSGQLCFTHRANGLYVHNTKTAQQCLVTTVADNESKYSRREVAQAREARQLQKRMANPTDTKLIKALNTGMRPDGSIIVELDQALYGCIESALLWYKELSTFLGSIGFYPNPYEKCILNKEQAGTQTTIAVYVDDLLISSGSKEHAEAVVNSLRN